MDSLSTFFLILCTAASLGTLVLSGFILFAAREFLQRMEERDQRWEKRIAELPTDVTGARLIELLEKHGIRVPPPVPQLLDAELEQKLAGWADEGVALADQAKRASPRINRLDKFRVAQRFVTDRLTELRVEVPPRRVTETIEAAVARFYRR